MIVVCDASPLVFLAKANRLPILPALLGNDIVVLDCVVKELLHERASPVETERLRTFLTGTTQPVWQGKIEPSLALSTSDQSSLTWAIEHKAAWLVADERLLRRVALDHGIAVTGFCGLLIQAARSGLLSPGQVRSDLDQAISHHGFRISVQLYREILANLEGNR
jgi:predicted nucleic acid-binding protein